MNPSNSAQCILAGVCIGVGLLGCSTAPISLPSDELSQARIAVLEAEQAHAADYSSENFRFAQDALAIAQDAYSQKQFGRSSIFAKKARLYSQVAVTESGQKKAAEKKATLIAQRESLKQKLENLLTPQAQPTATISALQEAADGTQ